MKQQNLISLDKLALVMGKSRHNCLIGCALGCLMSTGAAAVLPILSTRLRRPRGAPRMMRSMPACRRTAARSRRSAGISWRWPSSRNCSSRRRGA
jgi:hypothetical protein